MGNVVFTSVFFLNNFTDTNKNWKLLNSLSVVLNICIYTYVEKRSRFLINSIRKVVCQWHI